MKRNKKMMKLATERSIAALKTALKAAWLGSAFLCMVAPAANAFASSDAKMTVSATILKRASLKVLSQPHSVVITSADVARGYVDVTSPSRVAVRSNSQGGYMLMFESQSDFLVDARVRGLGNEIQLGASGVVPVPASGAGVSNATHDLQFRFTLSKSTREGTFAWPMQISAVPM